MEVKRAAFCFLVLCVFALAAQAKASQYGSEPGSRYLSQVVKMSDGRVQKMPTCALSRPVIPELEEKQQEIVPARPQSPASPVFALLSPFQHRPPPSA